MTTPQPNGVHSDDDIDADRSVPPLARSNTKTLRHQVAEIQRLVDHAMENLEQVQRALRYIEKDL